MQESADKIKLFFYSISHDLKSPAIGIHGLAMLLQKQSEHLHESETHHIFSVTDNGVGLREEDLEGIFEAFKRKKSAQGTQGTGLGLAIVKEIMARHGGDVWAEPRAERGVKFCFSISKNL